jgi:tRNA (guanosine-2'-O-)-methyltransferase
MKQLKAKPLTDFLRRDALPDKELVFVLQDVEDPVNVGAAFRIADACGAREIILTGLTPCPPNQTISGVARGMHRRIPWRFEKYASDALLKFSENGYTSYAMEVTNDALPYFSVSYPKHVCLVVGNEYDGVTKRTLAVCQGAVYIPMYGKMTSLNVHVALGIVAFQVLHQA